MAPLYRRFHAKASIGHHVGPAKVAAEGPGFHHLQYLPSLATLAAAKVRFVGWWWGLRWQENGWVTRYNPPES